MMSEAMTMRVLWFSIILLSALLVTGHTSAQNGGKADEPDFSGELSKIPPKSPEESLKAIKLTDGFHPELVASEPLIRSPMAMDFDEYGRAYVVELPEYNQYASAKLHGTGSFPCFMPLST